MGTALGSAFIANVKSGAFERPRWVEVYLLGGELQIRVAADNLKSTALTPPQRRPAAWVETPDLAKALAVAMGGDLEVIVASQKIADAIYASAKKTVFKGLVKTPADSNKMLSEEFMERYNRDADAQIAGSPGLVAGHDKYWLLHPRLAKSANDIALETANANARAHGKPEIPKPFPDPPSVNYGAWDAQGHTTQTVGGRHDVNHVDYSQVFRPVQRWAARPDGSPVDLLEWIETNESVPQAFTDLFRNQKP